eukprot:Mycagemm_TRINITY_DN10381_c2_g11::TRINITY_DN10381_c2_g11_i1::g.1161::m.1161 type:complete len:138 gc:universal TRINITY_DN10381_c2_g11_i1:428-15(-)
MSAQARLDGALSVPHALVVLGSNLLASLPCASSNAVAGGGSSVLALELVHLSLDGVLGLLYTVASSRDVVLHRVFAGHRGHGAVVGRCDSVTSSGHRSAGAGGVGEVGVGGLGLLELVGSIVLELSSSVSHVGELEW